MNGRPPLRHHLSRRSDDQMVTKSAQLWWALSTPSALQLASGETVTCAIGRPPRALPLTTFTPGAGAAI